MTSTHPQPEAIVPAKPLGRELDAWSFTGPDLDAAQRGEILLNPSMDFSNACNLNCPYCFVETTPVGLKRRQPGELLFSESLAVIDAFSEAGARTINIVGAGEPTVDPYFLPLIEHIARRNIRPLIFTNGSVFARKPDLATQVFALGASVVLKINSLNPAIQDAIVAHPGYAAERNIALKTLLATGFADPSPTRFGADILALNTVADELPHIYAWCRQNNIFPMIADYIPTGRTSFLPGQNPSESAELNKATVHAPLGPASRERLVSEIAAADRRLDFTRHDELLAYYGGRGCTQILGLYVDIQGRIWPCVARTQLPSGSRQPLGNTRNGDAIQSIWRTHPVMQQLRQSYTGACPYKTPIPLAQPCRRAPPSLQPS